MFCGKCGTNIPEGGVVCPACGTPTGAAPAAESGKKPVNKNLLIAIIGVVAVIALVVILISSCGGGNPESMAKDYVNALLSGDGEDIWDACNMEAALALAIEAGEIDEDDADDIKEETIENFDELAEWRQEYMEDLYGDDWSYDLEVTKVKEMKNSELRECEDDINSDDTDFEVEEGCYVTVKATFEGDEDDGKDKYTVVLVKIDGDWMIIS